MQLLSDACVYVRNGSPGASLWLAIYVDDILLMSTCLKTIGEAKEQLMSIFKMKDLGPAKFFLGVEFKRLEDGLELNQRKFTRELLARFNMLESKLVSTPMTPNDDFSEDSPLPSSIPYKEAIGGLLYLYTRTRPDIAQAVGMLSRKSSKPSTADWRGVKRVMRYLSGTEGYGLKFRYRKTDAPDLLAYSDADWTGDVADRKSTSGMVLMVNGSVIAWASRKQTSIALSSTESEYIAQSQCGKEVRRVREILTELEIRVAGPKILFEDNSGAISWATRAKCSKYVEMKYHHQRINRQGTHIDEILSYL